METLVQEDITTILEQERRGRRHQEARLRQKANLILAMYKLLSNDSTAPGEEPQHIATDQILRDYIATDLRENPCLQEINTNPELDYTFEILDLGYRAEQKLRLETEEPAAQPISEY